MSRAIRCVDDYFADGHQELFNIHFTGIDKDPFVSPKDVAQHEGRNELLAWFAEHLPDTVIEPIYMFTWDSGILAKPYNGTIAVHFDEAGYQKFMDRWEDGFDNSIDPRFVCYRLPLWMYLQRYNGKMPERPNWDEYEL